MTDSRKEPAGVITAWGRQASKAHVLGATPLTPEQRDKRRRLREQLARSPVALTTPPRRF